MNDMTQQTNARVAAARQALRTHDELRQVDERDTQFELGPDDLPIDARGWLDWHEQDWRPVYAAWTRAMDRLAEVLGDQFPGRHPFEFRPVCEWIVADAEARPVNSRPGNGTLR